ncbi:hypothetical protein [Bradyrhizobium neotropicale]|uniref:hypothetical protein n=1 Tax=Bradyrhizobium neotropicale TaxID=1497615 RepID=UPI001AD66818|nr:hypothetical protein [Bradyrhizobium neotropicale]
MPRTTPDLCCEPAAFEHAGNVAGVRNTIDRRGDDAGDRPAKFQDGLENILEEGRCQLPGQLRDKRFHLSGLWIVLSNAHAYSEKMSNAQEISSQGRKSNAWSAGNRPIHEASP